MKPLNALFVEDNGKEVIKLLLFMWHNEKKKNYILKYIKLESIYIYIYLNWIHINIIEKTFLYIKTLIFFKKHFILKRIKNGQKSSYSR